MVVVSGGDGGGGGWCLPRWWEHASSSLMVVRGLRVVSWGCGGLFPTCAAGVIYFLNNPVLLRPIGSAGWRVVIQSLTKRFRVRLSLWAIIF